MTDPLTACRSNPLRARTNLWRRLLVAFCLTSQALVLIAPARAQGLKPRPDTGAPSIGGGLTLGEATGGGMSPGLSSPPVDTRTADYIVAVVNQEPITHSEVNLRLLALMQETGADSNASREQLRAKVLETLIDERAQLAFAQETGIRVDDVDLDRAVETIAAQNEMNGRQLRERLRQEGQDLERFLRNLRERIILERVRERDVPGRIRISETEIDAFISEQLGRPVSERELSIAQILIAVKDDATEAEQRERRERAEAVLVRARSGEDFYKLAQEFSDDPASREQGGELGWKPAGKLPDLFVAACNTLKPGDLAGSVVRSGAGFHVLKLVGRRDAIQGYSVVQNHARHILLRPSPALTARAAYDKLSDIRSQILGGQVSFAQMARQFSQDGSATRGGDLGWSQPGQFVPEFQQIIDRMQPGQISPPITTRFGLHLIQLLERREVPVDPKQLRDNARNALREQRFESAYQDWARDIRAQAYVEIREPFVAR